MVPHVWTQRYGWFGAGLIVVHQTNPIFARDSLPPYAAPAGTLPHMKAEDLTPEQIHRVKAVVSRYHGYLSLLHRRMDLTGFVPGDRLYDLVSEAHKAVHALSVELHYLGVGSGVGRLERQ